MVNVLFTIPLLFTLVSLVITVTMSHPMEKSVWVSGLETPVSLSDVAGFFDRIGEIEGVYEVIDQPGGEDSALVVFVNTRSVQKALTLTGTNMRDNVISVTVPTESQLPSPEASPNTPSVNLVKSEFGKFDPKAMLSLLQELTILTEGNLDLT